MFSICQLPDDCLRPIFEHFTISEQLQLRLICKHWCTAIENIFLCKKVLKIFGSVENAKYYDLTVKKLKIFEENETKSEEVVSLIVSGRGDACGSSVSNEKSHFLAGLFPNIKFLVVYCLHLVSIDVSRLLASLSDLSSVTLFGMTKTSPDQQTQTWLQISQLEKLDSLHLFDMKSCSLPLEMLPRLSQLKHFSLSDYYSGDIVPILASLQCKQLVLEWIKCPMDDFEQALTKMNTDLGKSLTNLTMGQFYTTKFSPMDSVELLPFICTQFTELVHLDLGFVLEIPLVHASKHMSKLGKLQTLSLVVRSSALDNFVRQTAKALPTVHTLTLRRFCICFYKESSSRSNRIRLGELFPSLEHLTVCSKCTKCVHHIGNFAFGEGATKLKTVQVHSLM